MAEGAPYISVDPVTGQLIATYPSGDVVPVERAPAPAITSEGAPNAVQGTAGTSGPSTVQDPLWFAREPVQGTESVSGGYRSGGYSRGSYRDYGGSSGGGSYEDDYVPRPSYASGELHPAWGGDFRVPGGRAALEDDYDDIPRPQLGSSYINSPTSYGGGAYWNDEGRQGGGGRAGYGANSALGQAMEAKVRGMAGKVMYGDSGGSTGSYDSGGTGTPKPERMRGEYARGLDPTQAAGLSLRPQAMIPRVWGGLSGEMPIYQRLAALPAAQLGMLSGGYSGSTEDLANNIGQVYEQAGKGKLPSTQKLIGNLANSRGIEQMFEGQKAGRGDMESYSVPGYTYGAEPLLLGEASTAFGGLLDAALINEPMLTQEKYGSAPGAWGSYLTDKWGSKALGRKPGKGVPINKYVTKRIFR